MCFIKKASYDRALKYYCLLKIRFMYRVFLCKEKKSKYIIVNDFHLPSTIQFCHDSLAYIYAAYPSNDVYVLLSSDDIIHAI